MIDKDKKPKSKKAIWTEKFEQMQPGDSFYFETKWPSSVAIAFGYWVSRNMFTIEKEGNGHRFFWKNK